MNNKMFSAIVEARLDKLKSLLIKKGAEYSTEDDRLHNFKRGAEISGKHPTEVLDGFLLKHYVSYRDILDKVAKGETIDYNLIDEKLGDILAYYLILEALIVDTVYVSNIPGEFYPAIFPEEPTEEDGPWDLKSSISKEDED